jgi:hypothetical protein
MVKWDITLVLQLVFAKFYELGWAFLLVGVKEASFPWFHLLGWNYSIDIPGSCWTLAPLGATSSLVRSKVWSDRINTWTVNSSGNQTYVFSKERLCALIKRDNEIPASDSTFFLIVTVLFWFRRQMSSWAHGQPSYSFPACGMCRGKFWSLAQLEIEAETWRPASTQVSVLATLFEAYASAPSPSREGQRIRMVAPYIRLYCSKCCMYDRDSPTYAGRYQRRVHATTEAVGEREMLACETSFARSRPTSFARLRPAHWMTIKYDIYKLKWNIFYRTDEIEKSAGLLWDS